MNRLKIMASLLVVLGLLILSKPAYAGTSTLEICTSEYYAEPIQSHNFGYYGPYGYFQLHLDDTDNLECAYIGGYESLNNGTYSVSQVIESHWESRPYCWSQGGAATWSVNTLQQSVTVTITGSGTYVQCEFQNFPY